MRAPARKHYLLFSHLLGRGPRDGHIAHRVRWEHRIVGLLGMGYFSPFHVKTLKAITGVSNFGSDPQHLLTLLVSHAEALMARGALVVVVDDLDALNITDLSAFSEGLEQLLQSGARVLVESAAGGVMGLAARRPWVAANDATGWSPKPLRLASPPTPAGQAGMTKAAQGPRDPARRAIG
jgi:hypothetical protein